MDEKERIRMTTLDTLASGHQLQMIKAAIPYIKISEQKFFSIFVKFLELQNTMNLYNDSTDDLKACGLQAESNDPMDMLNDIKSYCSEKEQETIDMLINYLSAINMFNMYKSTFGNNDSTEQTNTNPMDALKLLLSPEQQSMMDTYSAMFNSP